MMKTTLLLTIAPIAFSQPAYPPPENGFIPPGAGSVRSPCPAINMLANHGFINRDGRNVLVTDLVEQLQANFPVVPGFSVTAAQGARSRGLFDDFNGNEVLNLDRIHQPQSMNGLEHQSSITRVDQNGDGSTGFLVDISLRRMLLEMDDKPVITRQQLMDYQAERIRDGLRFTDDYDISGFENTLATQATLLLAFGGNKDLEFAPKDIVDAIFFDEKVPDSDYNPATFSFLVDFAATPGMGVRTMFRENIEAVLAAGVPPDCADDIFAALGQILLGWINFLFPGIIDFCEFR